MSSDYLDKYSDYIKTVEQLFHMNPNDSIEEILVNINTILLDKYKIKFNRLLAAITSAIKFNFRSAFLYASLFNKICRDHSINYHSINYHIADSRNSLQLCFPESFKEKNSIAQIDSNDIRFPKEDTIHYMIMHDQIDKIKETSLNIDFEKHDFEISTQHFLDMSILEACAYYGSINTFFFLISNYQFKIDSGVLEFAYIGNNHDIIKECLKHTEPDSVCMFYAVASNNNEGVENLLNENPDKFFHTESLDIDNSLNIKAAYLLAKKDIIHILPWCAAMPYTLDILKNYKGEIDYFKSYTIFHSIFHYAVNYDCIEYCIYLITWPNIPFDVRKKSESILLHYAYEQKKKDIVKILLLNGANVDTRDEDNKTLFHQALFHRDKEMLKMLLSYGADINAKGESGESALHDAAGYGAVWTIKFLLKHGAKIDTPGKNGQTPLFNAAESNNKNIVELLVSHGANVNACARNKQTPLMTAIYKNCHEVIKYLLNHGANVNASSKEGKTALHYAAYRNSMKIAKLLISKGADTNAKDKDGETPLHKSVRNPTIELAELLLSNRADINAVDKNGSTPLHIAYSKNKIETAKFLISHGADTNIKDKAGKLPIEKATIDRSVMEKLLNMI
ncbi:ankyrin repeat protein, putative [Trichomonas vaginalis G3]|uniref:Ankyrin repeat protein, putative n=1 Tax=Trichomonas vaginalis (strain ATCC PRA-98 / G3) TaxID=412133 RepID=A2ECY5_TRIV3|nr:ankyrin repeat protein family [Trichomonas vaginalis G3]EAY09530.1 ankyrin repeat protein, putative [Trichomonas vaginalis G3]KAI5512991.1 ankyrin repeat protein family [Trichomonas vaginalis G3]|eukprot:XP_001321753.1 ankyrin repeat protein [Trichomonas vaginalis G3]